MGWAYDERDVKAEQIANIPINLTMFFMYKFQPLKLTVVIGPVLIHMDSNASATQPDSAIVGRIQG